MSFSPDRRRLLAQASMLGALGLVSACGADAHSTRMLNASFDATRELFKQYNKWFQAYWSNQSVPEAKGEDKPPVKNHTAIAISQSHGGSGKQARSVLDGLHADIVTLALARDIDVIAKAGLIAADWQARLPDNSSPFTSTIAFLVRKGNPLQIHDWPDLIRPDIRVVAANPKTSGGARWNYLAAFGYALEDNGEDPAKAADFIRSLYANVRVLDISSRAATTTFVERGIGDVLISWESELKLARAKIDPTGVEIVYPSYSILAEPCVAWVDKVVQKNHHEMIAKLYLEKLYSPDAQRIIGANYFRPRDPEILAEFANLYPDIRLFSIADRFGGWSQAHKTHFADGGVFDLMTARK